MTLATLAVALVASLVIASPAGASGARAGALVRPDLTIERNGGKVRNGQRVVLVATLHAAGRPLAGRQVSLHRASATVATDVTGSSGKARFRLEARETGTYEARFTPAAPEDVAAYEPVVSRALEIVVRPGLSVGIRTPLRAGRKAVGVPGQPVRVRGLVAPFVAGQRVVVRVLRGKREIRRRSVEIGQRGTRGRFSLRFRPPRRGRYSVRVQHTGGGPLGRASSRRARLVVVRPRARPGSRGTAVRALQRRLADLGFLTPVNGHFGGSTARAVLAFRKVNGMARVSSAGGPVFRRLARGRGGYRVRYPKAGKHVEFDWSRQVLVLARGSRPAIVVHASSGKASTPTVFGRFRFYSKTPGFNSKEMYYSSYFIGGYAIHGYKSVPTFPASHGCIRIPIPSAVRVFRWIDFGDPIYVYR